MSAPIQGWAVVIKREDGSYFFNIPARGIATPVWLTYSSAVKSRNDLIAHGFKARVVKVEYSDPRILSKGVTAS